MSKLSGLIKLKTRFLNAESPSPVKLSAAFRQVEDATKTLEYIVGNGNDTYIATDNIIDRLTLPNLSSAIGKGSNIYKPINKYTTFQEAVSTITPSKTITDGEISVSSGTITFAFEAKPYIRYLLVNKIEGSAIAISEGEILPSGSENDFWVACPVGINATSLALTITGGDSTNITELALVDATDYVNLVIKGEYTPHACNQAVSMPLTNNNYWRVRTPCILAYTEDCAAASCKYCIGNVYDENGIPQCVSGIEGKVYSSTNSPDLKIFQSCLLKAKTKPYQILNAPFGFDLPGVSADEAIPAGTLYIYDKSMATNPVLADITIYRATEDRKDIFYTKGLQEIVEASNRYLLVGGNYGVTDQLLDLHTITLDKLQQLQP